MTPIIVHSKPDLKFLPATSENRALKKDLTAIFKEILEPLYGSQDKALSQIWEGKDRTGYLLYEGEVPVGVIVFKTILSDEFQKVGVEKSIEIKSLFLVDAKKTSGRGVGTILLNKIVSVVKGLGLGQRFFHVTVSETKEDSLNFFLRKGFEVKDIWEGKYQKNTKEYLLAIPSEKIEKVAQKIFTLDLQPHKDEAKEASSG